MSKSKLIKKKEETWKKRGLPHALLCRTIMSLCLQWWGRLWEPIWRGSSGTRSFNGHHHTMLTSWDRGTSGSWSVNRAGQTPSATSLLTAASGGQNYFHAHNRNQASTPVGSHSTPAATRASRAGRRQQQPPLSRKEYINIEARQGSSNQRAPSVHSTQAQESINLPLKMRNCT